MIPPSLCGVPFVELSLSFETDTDRNKVSQNNDNTNNSRSSHYSRVVRYWSDRFYLTTTSAEEKTEWSTTIKNDASSSTSTSTSSSNSSCSCGHTSPPPLFPRERFVKSLDIRAAILGTYVWNPIWFATTFPDLVNSIPTLVLHGRRGLLFRRNDDENNNTNTNPWGGDRGMDDEYQTDTDGSDINTTTTTRNTYHRNNQNTLGQHYHNNENTDSDHHPPTKNILRRLQSQSSTVQMNYVRCTWKKPINDSSQFVSENTNTRNHQRQQSVLETRRGVHHPKFWLLLERSGSLVVMVTTANLTPTETVEGIWVQRFHPIRKKKREDTVSSSSSKSSSKSSSTPQKANESKNNNRHRHNDFGTVLQDFLTKLSQASQCTNIVDTFMTQHFGCPLRHFADRFHFYTAQVFLVPVVPGDYHGPTTKQDIYQHHYYYGHQRVQYILKTFGKHTPRNSKKTRDKSKSDRLILQPTSLGADWDRHNFASLVRGYMGYPPPSDDDDRNDDWVIKQADIVWPSDKNIAKWTGGTTLDDAIPIIEDGQDTLEPPEYYNSHSSGGFLFNSSDTFNRCEVSVLSRMCHYQSTVPQQQVPDRVPHFKSVARVIRNHNADIFHTVQVGQAETYLSWFLMTSACLSHGAQGVPVPAPAETNTHYHSAPIVSTASTEEKESNDDDNWVGYRNFELGVMFMSHIVDPKRKNKKKKKKTVMEQQNVDEYRTQRKQRLYCFHPKQCSCNHQSSPAIDPTSRESQVSLVHLPVPYKLRPESYFDDDHHGCDDDDDDDDEWPTTTMNETPFFHSIDPASRSIGNMLLTPFGRQQQQQQQRKLSENGWMDSDRPSKRRHLG
ncbi:tyrosyl-DNA phosphodiesterase [Nitzschia inconspicua]|uniref:Tyrosyl-DNA phosphodiesterase n=1 Tax=Nitzschia inconspicua TaxID=303405 RepID=A0A9K3M486_9STRA|nr:tyrosyl-DNA phosphodiesterase [Nitzschia inconspicua]